MDDYPDATVRALVEYGAPGSVAAYIQEIKVQRDDLLEELKNIANANPRTWDEDMRDQFQQWAQNRARAVIARAEGK